MGFNKNVDKVYEDYCENNNDSASKEVRDSLREYHIALDNYINAVVEDSWKAGFNYAMRLKSC